MYASGSCTVNVAKSTLLFDNNVAAVMLVMGRREGGWTPAVDLALS